MCSSCVRNATKPSRVVLKDIKRIHELEADSGKCFLAQGVLCLGPATRDGCGEVCININMPCRGCFGPVGGAEDVGAEYVSALSSILDVEDDAEMKKLIAKIDDPAGYCYRFTLPVSLLKRKRV